MTDRDDGDGTDPQLQSLRAVWLAMPDEDPPERGLADLMAAARVKAEQMAAPSLWQRISALLRRPPVLAFATVLVLIGGAVFIGQHHDEMQVDRKLAAERPREEPATVAAPPRAALGSSASEDDELPLLAEPMVPEPTFEPERKGSPEKDAQPALAHRPASAKKANLAAAKNEVAADKRAVARAESESESEPAAKPLAEQASAASDGFATPPAIVAAPESVSDDATTTRGAGPPKTGAAQTTTVQSAPSRTAQLLAQAKAASARGDCATARKLLSRIASEDASAYRNALGSDTSLKSCVTAAQ